MRRIPNKLIGLVIMIRSMWPIYVLGYLHRLNRQKKLRMHCAAPLFWFSFDSGDRFISQMESKHAANTDLRY